MIITLNDRALQTIDANLLVRLISTHRASEALVLHVKRDDGAELWVRGTRASGSRIVTRASNSDIEQHSAGLITDLEQLAFAVIAFVDGLACWDGAIAWEGPAASISPTRVLLLGLGAPYVLATLAMSLYAPELLSPAARIVGGLFILAAAAFVHYLDCFFRYARNAVRDRLAALLGIHIYGTHGDHTASWDADASLPQRALVWAVDAGTISCGIAVPLAIAVLVASSVADRLL
jgi:hypothetical protein